MARLCFASSVLIALPLGAPALAADSPMPASSGKDRAVIIEPIAGTTTKRVTLSPKAAERLDIQTGKVSEQTLVGTQMVGGVAAIAPEGTDKKSASELWIRVALSPAEWGRLVKDAPARILPLATRDKPSRALVAAPSGRPPREDAATAMLTLYFVAQAKESGLAPGDRVRVELQMDAGTKAQKVVPYAAVYYDAKGSAWVYVNSGPLIYQRARIVVDRIAGDVAVLSDGPAVGTSVVTVGAAMLYGAELFGK